VTCDADGVPLVVCVTAANVNDEQVVPRMLEQLPAVQGSRGGRPRRKPKLLLGDRAYGVTWLIALVVSMRIVPLLAPRLGRAAARAEHGSGLGKWRYVVERTLACFSHFRRLRTCYERTDDHFQALHDLAACLLVATRLRRPKTVVLK
jgi:hypothetical protein